MELGTRIISSSINTIEGKIPDELFERLLVKYPKGELPKLQRCYYTVLYPRFGKPFAIPDFVVNVSLPDSWINHPGRERIMFPAQQARMFAGQSLAPKRGGFFRWWLDNHFMRAVEFNVGFVAWEPSEIELPWTVRGEMPEFGYGFSAEQALEKFL